MAKVKRKSVPPLLWCVNSHVNKELIINRLFFLRVNFDLRGIQIVRFFVFLQAKRYFYIL